MSTRPTIPTDRYGMSSQPPEQVLAGLAQHTDVLLFGDTKHADPAIKGSIFGMLGRLREQGFSNLLLELDQKHQSSLEPLLAPESTQKQISAWADGINNRNKGLFAEGIYTAKNLGMHVSLMDDKEPTNHFRKENPEFAEMQKLFREKRASGMGIEEAKRSLFQAHPGKEAWYREKELEWLRIREGADQRFAQKIADGRAQHPKQVAIMGDGHFNTQHDVNEMLSAAGVRNTTIHVYSDLASYGEYLKLYMDRVPEDGDKRDLPDLVYFANMHKFAQPDHPELMKIARYAYDIREKQAPAQSAAAVVLALAEKPDVSISSYGAEHQGEAAHASTQRENGSHHGIHQRDWAGHRASAGGRGM